MSGDDLSEIPSFTANRDEAVSSAPRGAIPPRAAKAEAAMGLTARLVVTIALALAAIACAWAWQLQTLADTSRTQQLALQGRVADLEALLSDTDETVNKSAAAMSAQIRLIDTEVRKLWDARKVSNGKLTKVEKSVTTQEKTLTELTNITTVHSSTLETMLAELSALTQVAGDLERLAASAQRAQTDVERLADGLNKSNLERAALRKQVDSNGEWIESINAFRRQVNANMVELEADVAALRAPAMQ